MNNNYIPVTINNDNCDNCFKCVRVCNIKAITVINGRTSINIDKCIGCGKCYEVCRTNSITIDNHINRAKKAIKNNDIIIASLSPGWIAEFKDIKPFQMIEALKLLGFTHVSETTLGAEIVSKKAAEYIKESNDFIISSVCPVITKLIQKFHPSLTKNLLPLVPPIKAHALLLKEKYGNEAKIVVLDSCIESKTIAKENSDIIEAAITFDELQEWFKEEKIDFEYIPGNRSYTFQPYSAYDGSEYIIPRGLYNHKYIDKYNLNKTNIYNFSTLDSAIEILRSLETEDVPSATFIELFACKDGCTSGVGAIDKLNFVTKRIIMSRYEHETIGKNMNNEPLVYLNEKYEPELNNEIVDYEQINRALSSLFIDINKDHINCGACGFDNCTDFAKSLALGKIENSMCQHYLLNLQKSRFNELCDRLLSGVAIVGSNMKILELNRNFTDMLGHDKKVIYNNMDLSDINLPFADMISDVIESGIEQMDRDIEIKGKIIKVTVFTIAKHSQVGVLLRDMFKNEIRSEEIIQRTKTVIKDNLDTVQKIAYLLGENASKTEAILNSILESQLAVPSNDNNN